MIAEKFDVVYDNGEVMVTIPDKFTPAARARFAVLFAEAEDMFNKAQILLEVYNEDSLADTARALDDFERYINSVKDKILQAKRDAVDP
jgi:hypothetical protein